MGIKVEFNPDLALRNIAEYENGNRKKEECILAELKSGETYSFLKSDQRNYWLGGELPLLETEGNEVLSKPKASIVIVECTHFIENEKIFTKGKYLVKEVFNDDTIHFESYQKL